jgi:site-specific recombinase XerC
MLRIWLNAHSFAFNFLEICGDMYQLQAILGHKNVGMTVDCDGTLKAQDAERCGHYGF